MMTDNEEQKTNGRFFKAYEPNILSWRKLMSSPSVGADLCVRPENHRGGHKGAKAKRADT